MKFTMQKTLLAAAIATLAMTGTANAAMTNSASGDSSLILSVLDFTTGVSAAFDLGFTDSTFSQTTNNSWNIAGGDYASAWTSYAAAVGGNFAGTQWAVLSLDSTGTASGDQSIFTTVAGTWTGVSNSVLSNMQVTFDKYISGNNALGTHTTAADGGSFATASSGFSYAGDGGAYGSTGKIANYGGDTNTAIGTDMSVFNIVRNGTSSLTTSTATKLDVAGFNPYFSMSTTGALTYTTGAAISPVPEADNYAMLLAGLGLMGFIARRRMSV